MNLVESPGPKRGGFIVCGWLALCSAAGCGTQNPLQSLLSKPAGRDFSSAGQLDLNPEGKARLNGTVSQSLRDVWDLGPVNAGDVVILTARPSPGSPLDPTIAMFDENQDLVAQNDDVDAGASRFDSRVDSPIRWSTAHFYIAISSSFFSSQNGSYVADLQVIRGGTPPAPASQKLMLNFIGGTNINIPNVGTFNIDPFDASRVNPVFAGQTAQVKAGIAARVRQCYTGLHVIVQTSDDPVPIDGLDVSTLYFGKFSRSLFGISQQIDTWNQNICDDGIVFTDEFDGAFATPLTADQVAFAIGNVAAHEGGHLLGLVHVADVMDLMDTTGAASTLLGDQVFKRSVLDRSVFGFGFQNSPEHLLAVVGASP